MVDLVKMKAIVWNGEELGAKFEEQEIPEDMKEKVRGIYCCVVIFLFIFYLFILTFLAFCMLQSRWKLPGRGSSLVAPGKPIAGMLQAFFVTVCGAPSNWRVFMSTGSVRVCERMCSARHPPLSYSTPQLCLVGAPRVLYLQAQE